MTTTTKKVFTSDSWNEFSTGIVNLKEKVNDVIDGTQVVAKATSATSASFSSKSTSATSATYASTANYAKSAPTYKGATTATSGTKGLVPAATTATRTAFLRGDGTWVVPNNTTYANYKGATTASAGTVGLVPAATTATRNNFLRGDGTWSTVTSATSATVATSATYATNAGTATYSSNSAKATSATSATYAKTATNAGTATYSTSAGSASTATKLANSRTVRTNLGSTATASFDGTANITPGVTGVLPVANGGTGNSSVDTTPTSGSTKMVTSGGVYTVISELEDGIDNLITNLDDRTAIADLVAEADKGVSCRRIVVCGASTLNTPYSEGLINFGSGVAIIVASSTENTTIYYFQSGGRKIFIKAKQNGTWYDWEDYSDIIGALTSSDIVNNLTSTSTTSPLSANQGKVLNDKVTALTPVNNLTSTSTTAPLAANQGKVIKGLVDTLTSNLDTRTAVTDLLAEATGATSCRRIVYCSSNTLNTPYKEGLTSWGSGIAIITCATTETATILYMPNGIQKIFMNAKQNNEWLGWINMTDFSAYLPLSGGTMTGTGIYLNNGTGRLFADANQAQIESYVNSKDLDNRTALTIYHTPDDKMKRLRLRVVNGGTSSYYNVYSTNTITAGTTSYTAGTTELVTGAIHLVYS